MTYRQRANAILALSFLCFVLIFIWWYTHELSLGEEFLFSSSSLPSSGVLPTGSP